MTHDVVLRVLIERGWGLTRANTWPWRTCPSRWIRKIEAELPIEVRHVTGRRAARRELAVLVERLRLE